jgi:hypothetical protein
MRKITKRSVALVAGSVLAVAGGTAAFAYASGWFNGNATVTAAASTIQTVQVQIPIANTQLTRLWPGHEVTLPSVSINNPNDYPVKINTIGVQNVTSANKPDCGKDQAHLSFGVVPASTVLQPGTNSGVNLGKITMGDDAEAKCSGAGLVVTANMTGEIA